jgi:predicted HTH domain antitoxin
MSSVKTVRLPKNIAKAILHRVRTEKVDESTAIRQLLALGIEEYAVKLYREGRVTLGEASVLANVTLREMIDALLAHGVKGNVRLDQQRKAIDFVTKRVT